MARSAGIEGVRVDKAADLGQAVKEAIALERPYLIDANIGADANPGGAGVWELPGLGHKQPAYGGRHVAQEATPPMPIPTPGRARPE
jgi:acetolactate synthase-1/2/3 large subunit